MHASGWALQSRHHLHMAFAHRCTPQVLAAASRVAVGPWCRVEGIQQAAAVAGRLCSGTGTGSCRTLTTSAASTGVRLGQYHIASMGVCGQCHALASKGRSMDPGVFYCS